jgi:hypothetical protein
LKTIADDLSLLVIQRTFNPNSGHEAMKKMNVLVAGDAGMLFVLTANLRAGGGETRKRCGKGSEARAVRPTPTKPAPQVPSKPAAEKPSVQKTLPTAASAQQKAPTLSSSAEKVKQRTAHRS